MKKFRLQNHTDFWQGLLPRERWKLEVLNAEVWNLPKGRKNWHATYHFIWNIVYAMKRGMSVDTDIVLICEQPNINILVIRDVNFTE